MNAKMYDVMDTVTGDLCIEMAGVREIAVLLDCAEETVYRAIYSEHKMLHRYYVKPCLKSNGDPEKFPVDKEPKFEDIAYKLVNRDNSWRMPLDPVPEEKKVEPDDKAIRFYRTSASGGYWL